MKRSSPVLLEKLSSVPVQDVCMSVITKAELLYGVSISPHGSRDERALRGLLTYVEVLDFPEEATEVYAGIRADLKRQGRKRQGRLIGANDLLIAAHARCLDLILVTNNTGEFSRVEGLKLENWT